MKEKIKLPLDFHAGLMLFIYAALLAIVFFFAISLGARWSWLAGALIVGLLTGIPAAKWELSAINESWDEILHSPMVSFRLPYFRKQGAHKRSVYFLIMTLLVPLVYILISYNLYWYRFLSETEIRHALYLLVRWNGWYWFPYVFGLSFTSTCMPRLIAAASYKHDKIPYPRGVKDEK